MESDNMAHKEGIGLVGSVIVDVVSEVLEPGNLVYSDGDRYLAGADYESERMEYGTGGMALNNGVNFAKMGVPYPVRVMGKNRRRREWSACTGFPPRPGAFR